jgi:hypothetical protein
MAASPATFAKLVETILTILAEKPTQMWRQDNLMDETCSRTPYKEATVNLVIKSLVASGRIKGQMRGAKAVCVQYKEAAIVNEDTAKMIAEIRDVAGKAVTAAHEQARNEVAAMRKELEDAKNRAPGIAEIRLISPEGKTVKVTKGLFHAQFEKIAKLVKARMNVFIYGPTGCGKSHICHQVAETLGLRFAFTSCTAGMSEGVLGGRLLPVGKNGTFEYVVSEFVDCYENGGVFLLDEIDAADANVLLLVNAALANGRMAVPNRPDKPYAVRHPDFVCVAAANTVGTGADRMFSGRNKLDAATLDRFAIGKVFMGYDERVEADLCPDAALRNTLTKYRKAIMDNRLERAMSTRFMKDAYVMITKHGFTMDDVNTAFFQGWRDDEKAKILQNN